VNIALCFSGKLGKWRESRNSITENIIKPLKPDIFLSSWAGEDTFGFSKYYRPIKTSELDFLAHKKLIFRNGDNESLGIKPMCFGMLKSFELVKRSKKKYDAIIRLRPDLSVREQIKKQELLNENSIRVPLYESYSVYNHEKELKKERSFNFVFEKQIIPKQINDQIAIGDLKGMSKYMNIFNQIDQTINFLIKEGYPLYMSEVPESIITMALRINNVKYSKLSGTSLFKNLDTKLIK
jgi:hypothetical protein